MKLKLEKSITVKKIHVELPKKDMSSIIKQAILNAKKNKKESKSEPAPQQEKTIQEQITPAPEPVKEKPSENPILTQKVNKQWESDLKESGEKAPSDITQALAEENGMSEATSGEETSGFVGKYLQKQRDMKNKAMQTVIQQEKEAKDRMKEIMKEKIAAKPPPQQQFFQGTA